MHQASDDRHTGPGSSPGLAPAVATSELARAWLALLPGLWALVLKRLSDSSTPVTLEVQKSLKPGISSPEPELMHLGLPQMFLGGEEAEFPTSEQGPALLAASCAAQVVLLA